MYVCMYVSVRTYVCMPPPPTHGRGIPLLCGLVVVGLTLGWLRVG